MTAQTFQQGENENVQNSCRRWYKRRKPDGCIQIQRCSDITAGTATWSVTNSAVTSNSHGLCSQVMRQIFSPRH